MTCSVPSITEKYKRKRKLFDPLYTMYKQLETI